jgi:hypothetical protein
MQAGHIPVEFLPPEKFKQKAYIKDGETVRPSLPLKQAVCRLQNVGNRAKSSELPMILGS